MTKGGAAVIVGIPASDVMTAFDPETVAALGHRIWARRWARRASSFDVPTLVDLYRQGRLKLDELISGRYPLEEINAAIASVKRGEALRNVIMF